MKVHAIPDDSALAAIVLEPGERLVLKSNRMLRLEQYQHLAEQVKQAGLDSALILCDFDLFVLPASEQATDDAHRHDGE